MRASRAWRVSRCWSLKAAAGFSGNGRTAAAASAEAGPAGCLDDRRTVLAGLEIGGAGRLTSLDLGQRLEVPELVFIASTPLQVRLHGLSEHLDLEAGPLAYINQLREDVQWGGRVGVGVGFSRLRLRGVLPTVSFAMNYDFIPSSGSLPEVHQVAAGFRAGVSLPL